MEQLEYLFNPKSIAVIGASRDPLKWGNLMTMALVKSSYQGKLFLVNQKGGKVCGIDTFININDIPAQVDLAILGIPARYVPQAIEECIAQGIRIVVVVTAGFGETGSKGRQAEERIIHLAKASGVRLVGPNCLGVYNSDIDLNTTILPITPGHLGFITQSGNFGLEVSYIARRKGLGFSKFISIGNQIDIEFHEYLSYMGSDPQTKVILLFMEGLRNGRKFLEIAGRITRSKPVVVMKIGSTAIGRRSAKSHTGSLAGSDEIYDAAFKQAGIIRVSNSDELLGIGNAFASLPLPQGNRITVMTEGGGHATLASDLAESSHLEIPILGHQTQAKLAQVLLPQSSTQNPVDFAGAADADLWAFVKCAEILLQDAEIDGLIIVGQFGGYYDLFPGADQTEQKVAAGMTGLIRKYAKPIILQSMYARENPKSLEIMQKHGIPVYESVETALAAMGALFKYAAYLKRVPVEKPIKDLVH